MKTKNQMTRQTTDPVARFPVVSLGAEYLVMGHLLRRNILTYLAPRNNEGYDLICVHPDPKATAKPIRVQVKSRLASDCDRGFPVAARTFDAFDFLVVVFLNVGNFRNRGDERNCRDGCREPEFYTFPRSFIVKHHDSSSSWEKVRTRGINIERFKNAQGFESIAQKLRVSYPVRKNREAIQVDAETRFRTRAARGNTARGLQLLDKVDRAISRKPKRRGK